MRVDTLYGVKRSGVYKSISRPTRYTGVLGRNLVWFIPAFMAIQALIYGGLVPSQQAGTFPIIGLGQYKVRLEEIIIIAGFSIWLFTLSMARSSRGPAQQVLITRHSVSPAMILAIWAGVGLVQAAIRGIRAGNVNGLLDARILAVPLLYFVLAMFWAPVIRLTSLAIVLGNILFPLVVVLTLSSFLPIGEEIAKVLEHVNGVYGGYAIPLESAVVFFYCLVWARISFAERINLLDVLLVLFVTAGLVAKISKPSWVYTLEVPLFVLVVSSKRRLSVHKRSMGRTRWLLTALIVIVFLVSAVTLLRYFLPATIDTYMTSAVDRITRPDAGGDISGGRFEQMRTGFDKLSEAPIFGMGLGDWSQDYSSSTLFNEIPDHFLPLWVSIRAGIFTFIPVLGLIIWFIKRGYRVCKSVLNSDLRVFVTACFVYSLTIITYSLYGVPQNLFEPQILFWLSVAVVLSTVKNIEIRPFLNRRYRNS